MTRQAFEKIVEEALAGLPPEFRDRMENVVVAVESRATKAQRDSVELEDDEELFGLYDGVPLTDRGPDFAGRPDRIFIFQDPIEEFCETRKQMILEIQDTLIHEIGHFFGLDEDEIGAIEAEYDEEDED